MKKRIILLQTRSDKDRPEQEFALFNKEIEKEGALLERLSLFDGKLIGEHVLDRYHGIIIGGSSFAPADDYPQKSRLKALVQSVLNFGAPLLGVCFGFEVLVDEIGGDIVLQKDKGHEFGTRYTYLTEAGKKDKLFSGLPDKFLVNENHHWHAPSLPNGAQLLSYGNAVMCQALKIANKPVYGIQFHPELDVDGMRYRVEEYRNGADEDDIKALRAARIKNTARAPKIIRNFVRYIAA